VETPNLPCTGGMPKPPSPPESDALVWRSSRRPSWTLKKTSRWARRTGYHLRFSACTSFFSRDQRTVHSTRDALHASSFTRTRSPRASQCLLCSAGCGITFFPRCSSYSSHRNGTFSGRAMQLLRSTLRPPSGARRRPSGWLRGLRLCGCPLEWHTNVRDRG
jgi:hypothetical protein